MKSGYWNDFNNVRDEMNGIITKLGHLPTSKELGKIGQANLYNAIRKHYGGLNRFRESLFGSYTNFGDFWRRVEQYVKSESKTKNNDITYFGEFWNHVENKESFY